MQDIANAPSGERTLKVSATTPPKKLAGSIVLVCEGGEAPMLLPLGAACVNQVRRSRKQEKNVWMSQGQRHEPQKQRDYAGHTYTRTLAQKRSVFIHRRCHA